MCRKFVCSLAILCGLFCSFVGSTNRCEAAWTPFVIRNASGSGNAPQILPNSTYTPDGVEIRILESGQKVGYGSNDHDGIKLGDLTKLSIGRYDDRSSYAPGSGPSVAPYINIWITDGTNYAVIANEPSNPEFNGSYNNGYDFTGGYLSNKTLKVYENADKSWLPNAGVGLTFADLAAFTIKAPSAAELTAGWAGLGTGAPRTLSNEAFGINWVFGDTLTNYVSGSTGYIVGNPAAAIPEPGTMALLATAAFGAFFYARRKAA